VSLVSRMAGVKTGGSKMQVGGVEETWSESCRIQNASYLLLSMQQPVGSTTSHYAHDEQVPYQPSGTQSRPLCSLVRGEPIRQGNVPGNAS
jgi:hypothetical protein